MANVAKWLTHRVVVPAFEGSIPFIRPIFLIYMRKNFLNEPKILNTNSESETKNIGKELLSIFPDKKLFILKGDLGVGKTIFVKGVAKSLKIKDEITSPTFGVKNAYDNKLFHYDLYMSKSKIKSNEFFSQIIEDLDNGVVIIEWGEKLSLKKISDYVFIEIKKMDDTTREITLKEF